MSRDEHNSRKKESPCRELVPVQPGALRTAGGGVADYLRAEDGARGLGGGFVLGTREHSRGGGICPGRTARAAFGAPGAHSLARWDADARRRHVRHVLASLAGLPEGLPSRHWRGGRPGADRRLARLETNLEM